MQDNMATGGFGDSAGAVGFDAGAKAGKGWKITSILGIVGVVALTGVVVFLAMTKESELTEKENKLTEVKGELAEKKEVLEELEGSGVVVPDMTLEWKTFKTEKLGLSFDYPSDWTVKSSTTNYEKMTNYLTTVKSPLGLELQLAEDFVGGLGGMCDDKNPFIDFLKKEADVAGLKDMSVVSTVGKNPDEREYKLILVVTGVKNLGAGRSVRCEEGMFFEWLAPGGAVDFKGASTVSFKGRWSKITSGEEYAQAVKILSSLRQE